MNISIKSIQGTAGSRFSESHWDRHRPTRPCRTQQRQAQPPPGSSCASWRRSCRARAPSARCPRWRSSVSLWSGQTFLECCFQMDSWAEFNSLIESNNWWVLEVFSQNVHLPVFPPKSCRKCLEDVERRRQNPLLIADMALLNLWKLQSHTINDFVFNSRVGGRLLLRNPSFVFLECS